MTAVCEDYHQLDLAWLRRRRMLTPGFTSVVTWSMNGNKVGAIRIVVQEHAIVPHLPHALLGRGAAGCERGRNGRLGGHGLWRAPALVCVPPLHEGLQGALRLGCQRERTSRQGALEQFHERGGRNRKHATAPDRKNQFCLQERWVDQRKSNHVSRWNAT